MTSTNSSLNVKRPCRILTGTRVDTGVLVGCAMKGNVIGERCTDVAQAAWSKEALDHPVEERTVLCQ